MKVLILSLVLLSSTAFAAEQKTKSTSKIKDDSSKNTMNIDPSSEKEEMADQTATLTDKHPMKAHVICKAKDGHELKQGDAGYDACIQKVKADKNSKSAPSADVEVKLEK